MKKQDVVVGETYKMNHTSGRIKVRILAERKIDGYGRTKARTWWTGLNLSTGREITIKSAVKLTPVE